MKPVDQWDLIPIRSRLSFCRETLVQLEEEALDLGLDDLARVISLARVKTGEAFRQTRELENSR